MSTQKPKILITLEDDLIIRIDDFRYENRIPSRSEAIRRLIAEALEKYGHNPGTPQVKSRK